MKLKYVISQICIPYSKFKELSNIVKYCPILLPFGWVVRFFKYLFTNKKQVKSKLNALNNLSNEHLKQFELINKFLNK